ncbi:FCD domain-containing protein [Aminobacter sp. LjRoot7]|uniref:FCD domain-containing protein n=1 Tax=unclassified Aminobacter TaxID=2644704 RepID=UPI003F4FDB78
MIDTYLIRKALEKCAVRLCVERATDEELNLIQESVENYSRIDVALESYFSLNERFIDFHVQIVRAANNDISRSQYASIIDRICIINRMHMNWTLSIADVQVRQIDRR